MSTIIKLQQHICTKYGVSHHASPPHLKIGIALNVRDSLWPINGLRHPPETGMAGWFVWAGEHLSSDANFFKPLHVAHLADWCPQIQKYLGLPPGWRFLIAPDYEDVWYDETLLQT